MSAESTYHTQWTTRWAFILAATGSAVGLGNIWRFPYMAGENGGGAFVLVYLLCIALIGLPVMMAEIAIGRRGRQSPINSFRTLARLGGHWVGWRFAGWLGVIAGFFILSFYSVVAGWALAYVIEAARGAFEGAALEDTRAIFGELVANPAALLFWHTVFMLMVGIVVARGVQSGIERAVRILMPALLLLLVALVLYAMNSGGFAEGLAFLFAPDFSRIGPGTFLAAMGQAFFTLSLGMGAIMVYGSYLESHASIPRTAGVIVVMDTAVALLAGLAIFPLIFALGLEVESGPALVFEIIPLAFGSMPWGSFFATLFFVLLVFAAWTSAISLIEPLVAYFSENRAWSRRFSAWTAVTAIWLAGLGSVVSFNVAADVELFFGMNWFAFIDFATNNVMLPLGGLLIAMFVAWVLPKAVVMEEIGLGGAKFTLWYTLIRFITPIGVVAVFLNAIGVI